MTQQLYCTWTTCHMAQRPLSGDCAECSQRIEYDAEAKSETKTRKTKKGEET